MCWIIGRGITHKRVIVELYTKGYNPLEIARMTDHELKNVETYIEDMERVRLVASKDKQTISRLTGLSVFLVEEYLEIIRTYYTDLTVSPKAYIYISCLIALLHNSFVSYK